jgi:phospholipase D1/2
VYLHWYVLVAIEVGLKSSKPSHVITAKNYVIVRLPLRTFMSPKFAEVIQQTIAAKQNDHAPLDNDHVPLDNDNVPLDNGRNDTPHNAALDYPIHTHFEDEDHLLPSPLQMPSFAQPDTPSARTGPPRSLSFAYSLPNSPSRNNSKGVDAVDILPDSSYDESYPFSSTNSDFRGALEYKDNIDRKGKRRESRLIDESWNPMRWFHESPKEEKSAMDFPSPDAEEKKPTPGQSDKEGDEKRSQHSPSRRVSVRNDSGPPLSTSKSRSALRRAFSTSTTAQPTSPDGNKDGKARWARLRALLPHIVHPDESILPGPSAVTSQAVNITDELIAGGLSTLMLRLWFERDEKGQRRVPTLFHRLRIRVSDSLHPMHDKSIFRIECEYANGAARWVIYRELRDFLSLHAHYAVSNVYNRNVDRMPEFPRTSEY